VVVKRFAFLAAGLAGLLTSGAALAQAAPATAQRPGPPEVKEIGDWSVRCFPVDSPSPCDMYEELDNKKSHQRVLSVSIAYVPHMDRHAIQISVPLGVALQKGLVIQSDSYTSPALHYRQCDRSGCFVQMMIDNAAIESLAKSGPDAKVKVVADGGKPFDLRFSLNGFAAAHDSMVAQAKAKAKAPKPAAATPATAPATIDASAPAVK
jgi:invasion protein IalB